MKKFFVKIKDWFVRHWPSRRRIIQFYTFLLYNANSKGYINGTIFKGNSKYACVPGINCYSCPGAVAACPLGALQNALNASSTTTAYYIFGIIALFGLILGRMICGFFCPVGLGQELLFKIKTPKIGKSRYTRLLSYLKYALLVVLVVAVPVIYALQGTAAPGFCKYICPAGTFEGGLGLILNPANQAGSRNLLDMLGPIFTWKFAVLVVIIVLSVFMYRPFCRFICPLGAIYGFFNPIALMGVKLEDNKCTDCGLCITHCKMDVKHVGDHECINCGECISVCPAKAISWKGSKIFVRGNDIPQPLPAEGTIDIKRFAAATTVTMASGTANSSEAPNADTQEQLGNETAEITATQEEATTTAVPKKKRGKRFWIEFSAWAVAIAVLISAFVYFNLQPEGEITDINVGNTPAPEFSLNMYGYDENNSYVLLDEKFNSADHEGKVMVVNFWATWCGPCVHELPYFAEVAEQYEDIIMVAVHGNITEQPHIWMQINKGEWLDWLEYGNFYFVQDNVVNGIGSVCTAFGGTDALPYTAIIGKDGKISFVRQGELPKDILIEEVEKALAAPDPEETNE